MKVSHTKRLISHVGALIFILLSSFLLTHDSFAAATWLSSMTGADVPTSIALDAKGNIYVTEARNKNRLRIFDRNGALLRTLSVKKPSGVAVDGQGRIYVANSVSNSVDVYNSDLTLSHSLGAGKNEFRSPKAVVVSAKGMVYVSDSKDNLIKVYNPNGTKASSFGGWGKTDGKFNVPLGLAIYESKGELYVTDLAIFVDGTNGDTYGARVQVFDLLGTFKRSFGTYGAGEGKMIRPVDISLDGDGRVYVADSFQGVIHVFDGYGAPIETIFDANHPTKTPISVTVGKDKRVFIASNNQKAVEVFAMSGYTTMDVSPKSLSFTAGQGSVTLPAQAITITNSGTGTLGWSAAADRGWITVAPASGSAAPSSTLSVGVNTTGLSAGSYSGSVTVTAASGAAETVPVQLTVTPPPAALSVTPASLAFTAQQNGSAPSVKTIDIRNSSGGAMTWTAAKSQPWLSLSAATGAAPSQITASVSAGLPVGTHTDTVTITAPGALGSPALVSVTVTVSNTGTMTITTNLSQAKFTVTGPAPATTASLTGSGTLWKNEEMAPGDYTVTFNHVSGYKKPAPMTVAVAAGNETAVQADYLKKAAATHIVAVTGAGMAKKLSVMTLGGELVSSFKLFAYAVEDVHVASGDLDASGTDKIVAADSLRGLKVFSTDGSVLAAYTLPKGYKNAGLAVGDIDGDGKVEIVLGTEIDRIGRPDIRGIRLLGYAKGRIEEKALVYSEEKDGGFTLALGDLNGDGKQELVMTDVSGVRAFSLAGGVLGEVWSVQGSFKTVPKVSAGDLNDDGNAEVVLSRPGVVQVLTGTGEPTGVIIGPMAETIPAAVACGDVDGDGVEEIATRTGESLQSAGTVRFLEGDGSALGTAVTVKGGVGGANFCLGSF